MKKIWKGKKDKKEKKDEKKKSFFARLKVIKSSRLRE